MKWLVVCGLDGALVGDDAALKSLNTELVQARPHLVLAYLTGRSFTSVMELRKQIPLLPADLIACDGGTSLWQREGDQYLPVVEWMNLLNGGWRRSQVRELARRFNLQEQPPQHQGPFKCSYFLDPVQAEKILPLLKEEVEAMGARVYYKAGYLDFLATDRAEVVDYLHHRLKIGEEQTIFCEEGFPDDHMTHLKIKSVLLPTTPLETSHNGNGVYFAQQPLGSGVLEGLRHWGVLSSVE